MNYDAYKCTDDPTLFCPYNIVGYWGLSSKHDMINYFTNYEENSKKFLIDFTSTDSFAPPHIYIAEEKPAMVSDKAITLKMNVNTPLSQTENIAFLYESNHSGM